MNCLFFNTKIKIRKNIVIYQIQLWYNVRKCKIMEKKYVV